MVAPRAASRSARRALRRAQGGSIVAGMAKQKTRVDRIEAPGPDGGALERVPIDSLTLDPRNARMHNTRNIEAIKASLQRFGQVKPIVIDRESVVLAGNGTMLAARELGWTSVAVVRTHLAGADARAYAIADNRTAELAEWDEVALTDLLQSLRDIDEQLLAATGFDASAIEDLAGQEAGPEDFPEASDDIQTNTKCPRCGFQWSKGGGNQQSAGE